MEQAELRAAAAAWADDDPDPATAAEVRSLLEAGDDAGLRKRFSERLQFGTAGLRGPLGAGPARMNRALVRRAAAGLAGWLQGRGDEGPVVVGFDARHGSRAFAEDTCAVLAGAGLDVRLLAGPLPTPVLAFALRHLDAAAGVMVTASHNPAADNGYKVYDGTGGQIVPPVDAEISAAIDAVGRLADVPLGPVPAPLGPDVVDAYLAGALATALVGKGGRDLRIVTTATHGVGGALLLRLLAAAGFGDVHPVPEQQDPDPDFPTLPFPNPEEPGVLDLAIALAREVGADLVLANDPDADRLGAAVPDPSAAGGWRALRGDEVGVLLGDHLLTATRGRAGRVVASSLVSSTMLGRVAAAHGVRHATTLTGFKWIVRAPGPGERLVFGYEEALGYCVGDLVRDKDGLTSALCLAELVADLRAADRTVLDALDDLARAHGVHLTAQRSLRVGPDDQAALMARLRAAPPSTLAGRPATCTDLRHGGDLPPADVLVLTAEGRRVIVRPSGTEPKLKTYLEAVEPVAEGPDGLAAARAAAEAALAALSDEVAGLLALDPT